MLRNHNKVLMSPTYLTWVPAIQPKHKTLHYGVILKLFLMQLTQKQLFQFWRSLEKN